MEDIIALVVEKDEPKAATFVDDEMLDRNFESLRKKVFVKEKVVPIANHARPIKVTTTFKSGGKWAKPPNTSSLGSTDTTTTASRDSEAESQPTSVLGSLLEEAKKENEGDFLLPNPNPGDPTAVTIKIYLFGTP